ncbi:hypothetical protein ABK040_005130 [Willaertia magna]
MYNSSSSLLSYVNLFDSYKVPNVLIIGTGEYVTGFNSNSTNPSDKPIGIVLLTLIDLKLKGKINNIYLSGTNGTKFKSIFEHLNNGFKKYKNFNSSLITKTFPDNHIEKDNEAYKEGLKQLNNGDVVFIFTPDNTHFQIAKDCLTFEKKLHVLIAKPLVQTLEHHLSLIKILKEDNNKQQLCGIELHKRWDPMYQNARERIFNFEIGDFSYYHSYMSQPQSQLNTFKSWAQFSDISFYLNAHHIDFHCWTLCQMKNKCWRPVHVFANASYGVANSEPYCIDTEDSISLMVQWEDLNNNERKGTAIYVSSWVAPNSSEVHSQQRFFFQGSKGEIQIDQAHRGYDLTVCDKGLKSVNPLFMNYSTNNNNEFNGQNGYGYQSLNSFIECVFLLENKLETNMEKLKTFIPSVDYIEKENEIIGIETLLTTSILEAGRLSLNKQKRKEDNNCGVKIIYDEKKLPIKLQ